MARTKLWDLNRVSIAQGRTDRGYPVTTDFDTDLGDKGLNKIQVTDSGLISTSVDTQGSLHFRAQVFTAAASSPVGATVKLQGSLCGGTDDSVWFDISGTATVVDTTVGNSTTLGLDSAFDPVTYKFIRAVFVLTSGTYDMYALLCGTGDS